MRQLHVETVPEWLKDGKFGRHQCVFDRELPWPVRKAVLGLSARVRIFPHSVETIRRAAATSHIVYAMKHPSDIDLHFLRIRFAELGLPVPVMTLGGKVSHWSLSKMREVWRARLERLRRKDGASGEDLADLLKTVLLHGSSAVFSLVDDEVFRERYVHPDNDPLAVILECQSRLPGAISLTPLTILHDRTPPPTVRPLWETFLGDPDRPGLLRRLAGLMRKWAVPEVLVGDPINLVAQFEEFGAESSWEELPFEIRARLIANVNDRIRVNRGPEEPSKTEIKERVLRDAKVMSVITQLAAKENTPQEKLRKKAESYVDEIAAARSMRVIWLYFRALGWVFRNIFDGIDSKETQFTALKEAGRKRPLIFVSCHKSHFDYLVVPYLSFKNHMAIPYIAAGSNLLFWPLGPALRKGAGFFMRRSFKGKELYREVFVSYLKTLLVTGHSLKFYAEGGRSRIGRLLPPRLGLLAFLLEAQEDGAVDDLTFAPVFVGYEHVPEESSYLSELAGRDKKKESIGSLVGIREILAGRYGRIHVRFNPTVSLADFRKRREESSAEGNGRHANGSTFLEDLGYHLMAGIIHAGVVSPVETVSHAVLYTRYETFTLREVMTTARRLFEALAAQGTEITVDPSAGELAVLDALPMFESRKFIETSGENPAGEPLYRIVEDARKRLEFHANALVNYLWPISLAAALANKGNTPKTPAYSEFSQLKTMLRREFIPDPLDSDRDLLDRAFCFLFDVRVTEEPGQERAAAPSSVELDFFSRPAVDLMRTYLYVIEEMEGAGEDLSVKDLQKRVVAAAMKGRSPQSPLNFQAVSLVVVGNAVTRLHEMGLLGFTPERKLVHPVSHGGRERLSPWSALLKKFTDD